MSDLAIAVFSASWTRAPRTEAAAATRSIAGALSRLSAVDVFVPGDGPVVADGAFDLTPVGVPVGGTGTAVGSGAADGWLVEAAVPAGRDRAVLAGRYRAVLVEAGDYAAAALAASVAPDAPVLHVGRAARIDETDRAEGPRAAAILAVDLPQSGGEGRAGGGAGGVTRSPAVHRTGLYARVHPGASARRHYGLRTISDYLLVLGDRPGAPVDTCPSPSASWLLARFPRRHVVVVEGGVARVWRSRSCIAAFGVHSRMDLWILMAQATGLVDLLPGGVFARECIESLRYGVPVAVPAGSAADGIAERGGLRFSSTAELLSCADALFDPAVREALGSAGRAAADHWYGDPEGLVRRLEVALGQIGAPLSDPT